MQRVEVSPNPEIGELQSRCKNFSHREAKIEADLDWSHANQK